MPPLSRPPLLRPLIPLPNSGNNYVSFTPGPVQINQYTGDVLQQISTKDSLHGFYAFQKDVRTEPALQGDTIPGWGDHRDAHRQMLQSARPISSVRAT